MNELLSIEDQAGAARTTDGVIWELPSSSEPGVIRRYNLTTNFCTCPGYEMSRSRSHECRHGQAVRLRIAADTAAKQAGSPTILDLRRRAEAAAEQRRRENSATVHQIRAFRSLCRQLGLTEAEALAGTVYDRFEEMSRRAASGCLDRLTREATGVDVAGAATGSSFSVVNGKVEHREAKSNGRISGFEI